MIDERLFEQFRYIGRDIFDAGLTSSHGGNLSVRVGDRIIIKRRGAQFRRLKPEDFVETRLYEKDSGLMRASTELIVHREIYLRTSALAVVHCHPRAAIALSLCRDEIIPIDNEGSYLLKKIPVSALAYDKQHVFRQRQRPDIIGFKLDIRLAPQFVHPVKQGFEVSNVLLRGIVRGSIFLAGQDVQ